VHADPPENEGVEPSVEYAIRLQPEPLPSSQETLNVVPLACGPAVVGESIDVLGFVVSLTTVVVVEPKLLKTFCTQTRTVFDPAPRAALLIVVVIEPPAVTLPETFVPVAADPFVQSVPPILIV
jgi:hypothetical protein